jgi:hypothetical protein
MSISASYSIIANVKNSVGYLFPQKPKKEKLNFFDILQNE